MNPPQEHQRLSIVIPCYNEQETLDYTFERIKKALSPIENRQIDLVFVNDGSTDSTTKILDQLVENNSNDFNIHVVEFSRNFGHSAAVLAGLTKADGDHVAIIDADLQDPPELIPEMLKKIGPDVDVVYGQRTYRDKETIFKRSTAWLFYRLMRLLTGLRLPNDSGDFRVMKKQVRDAVLECGENEPFIRGLVAWVGFKQQAFPYRREARKHGTTKYPFHKMFRFALTALVSFSSKPLQIGIYFGFLGLLGALILAGIVLWAKVQGQTIPGWASTFIGFLAGQSMTLVLLGIMGAYIAKVHAEVKQRPRFIIRREKSKRL